MKLPKVTVIFPPDHELSPLMRQAIADAKPFIDDLLSGRLDHVHDQYVRGRFREDWDGDGTFTYTPPDAKKVEGP